MRRALIRGTAVRPSAKNILMATAAYFGTEVATLRGSTSDPTLHHARMIAMYLCWELLDYSCIRAGRALRRDPVHAMYARLRVQAEIASGGVMQNQVHELISRLRRTGHGG